MIRSRRIISVIIMAAAMLVFSPFDVLQANAQTLTDYDSEKAVKYAKSTKKNYKDCVKFVRLCAEKGGVPAQEDRPYEFSAEQYAEYLISEGYAVKTQLTLCDDQIVSGTHKYGNLCDEDNTGKISEGDLLLYKCKKCGKYFHMAIATGTEAGVYDDLNYWIICAHSANGQMIKDLPFYCYEHKGHGRNNVAVYALHITSSDNGFKACTKKVKGLKAKAITEKKVRLKWNKVNGAVAYNIFARGYAGGPVLYQKQVKSNSVKIAIPKNSKGKYYNYKNVQFTVAPVFKKAATFNGVTKKYKVVGKKCSMVYVN